VLEQFLKLASNNTLEKHKADEVITKILKKHMIINEDLVRKSVVSVLKLFVERMSADSKTIANLLDPLMQTLADPNTD
jgi:hypothetical protein